MNTKTMNTKDNEHEINEGEINEGEKRLKRHFHVNEELKQPRVDSSMSSRLQHLSDILEFLRFQIH